MNLIILINYLYIKTETKLTKDNWYKYFIKKILNIKKYF